MEDKSLEQIKIEALNHLIQLASKAVTDVLDNMAQFSQLCTKEDMSNQEFLNEVNKLKLSMNALTQN